MGGSLRYNNGVYLLNDLCETLYSKKSKGIKARSIRESDIEYYLTDAGKTARNSFVNESNIKYNEIHEYERSYYPDLYKYEKESKIN